MLKNKKLTSFFAIVIAVFMMSSMFLCAFAEDEGEGGAATGGFGSINPEPKDPGFGGVASSVIGIMQWVGYAIAVGMLVYIGIKYIMASADEKANLKGAAVKYVIGAVLIVFAVTIANAVFNLG